MHPAGKLIIVIGIFGFFGSIAMIIFDFEIPIGDEEEAIEKEEPIFDFSGQIGNITLKSENEVNLLGWRLYVLGNYIDTDNNSKWDSCEDLEVFVWIQGTDKPEEYDAQENLFDPTCEVNNTRQDLSDFALVYSGNICFDSSNSSSMCNDGNYSVESNSFIRIVREEQMLESPKSFSEKILDYLSKGYVSLCISPLLILIGFVIGISFDDEENNKKSPKLTSGPQAEWRAYSLAQSERGSDGLAKSFGRHLRTRKRQMTGKTRKGNIRGGVHKGGGLFLGGWTEEDSNEAYKKKVEDRRDE